MSEYAVYARGKELHAIPVQGRTAAQIDDALRSSNWFGAAGSTAGRAVEAALKNGFRVPDGATYQGTDGEVTSHGRSIMAHFRPQKVSAAGVAGFQNILSKS
jgi:hypothetical protein